LQSTLQNTREVQEGERQAHALTLSSLHGQSKVKANTKSEDVSGLDKTESVASAFSVSPRAADGILDLTPPAAGELNSPGVNTDYLGSSVSTCAGSSPEGHVEDFYYLDGTWNHSRGGYVFMKVVEYVLIISNAHTIPHESVLSLLEFWKGDTLHYQMHTGSLQGNAIRWSNGSVWTKLPEQCQRMDKVVWNSQKNA